MKITTTKLINTNPMATFAFYFGLLSVILGFIAWAWVRGIDNMMDNHPDYKGEDLFDDGSDPKV